MYLLCTLQTFQNVGGRFARLNRRQGITRYKGNQREFWFCSHENSKETSKTVFFFFWAIWLTSQFISSWRQLQSLHNKSILVEYSFSASKSAQLSCARKRVENSFAITFYPPKNYVKHETRLTCFIYLRDQWHLNNVAICPSPVIFQKKLHIDQHFW